MWVSNSTSGREYLSYWLLRPQAPRGRKPVECIWLFDAYLRS